MQSLRLGGSMILGVIIAFALFILMSALIDMGDTELNREKAIKIEDFTMPSTEIDVNVEDELPEKLDEVEAPPPEVEMQEVELDNPDSALNISTGAGGFKPEISTDGGVASDSDYIPVYIPQPRYPPRAEKTGKTGYAVVEVTITTNGSVRDVKLLEEWPENYGFGKSALKAAEKLKYNPRVVNGVAVEVPGVLYKFNFAGFGDKRR